MDHTEDVIRTETWKEANGIGGGIEVGGRIGHGNEVGGENWDVNGDGAEPEQERELRGRRTKERNWERGREREWGGTETETQAEVETCRGT